MKSLSPFGHLLAATCAVLVAVAALSGVAGCSGQPAAQEPGVGTAISPAVVPEKSDLRTPDAAVRTYLGWVTLAYRMANSDVASKAASPYEGVRVDSYIELNRQSDKGIEQLLVSFKKTRESQEGTRVVLVAKEDWKYRYFSLSKRQYLTPMYATSYDTTYTLVKDPTGWLVDKVEAKALTPVK